MMAGSSTIAGRGLLLWALLSALALGTAWGTQTINIGILSDGKDDSAIDSALLQELVHNTSRSEGGLPLGVVQQVTDRHDPLAAAQAVCSLLDEGVAAIVDVSSTSRSSPAATLCEAHHVPCLFLKAERHGLNKHGEEKTSDDADVMPTNFAINLQPTKDDLAEATHNILREMQWSSFTLLYDTVDHLGMVETLLTDPYFRVTLAKIQNKLDIDVALDGVRMSSSRRVVIAMRPPMLRKLASVAIISSANNRPLRLFVATTDPTEAMLQELAQGAGPVTALRLGDSDQPQQSLLRDATRVVASAVGKVPLEAPLKSESDLCRYQKAWEQGQGLVNTMMASRILGETGLLAFTSEGARSDVQYGVMKLSQGGGKQLIRWPSTAEVAVTGANALGHRAPRDLRELTGGVVPTLRVSALLREPFVMIKEQNISDYEDVQIAPEYEGFCIDMLDEIAAEAGFEYTLTTPEDGMYGSYDAENDEWTGAIGDLVNQRVDVVIGDMSLTEQREAVVDFTDPWLNFGIGLLTYRGGSSSEDIWFLFLAPFSADLWGLLLGAGLGVAVLLFFIARLSPYERNAPQSEEYQRWTPFTFATSLWFALGTLFRQFVVVQPRAASTRVLTLCWWFFVVVVAAFYVANLVHFLEVKGRDSNGVESIYDLPNQRAIKYGALYQGSTWAFFRDSKSETLQRIFSGMKNQADLKRVMSSAEGVEHVRDQEGSYAFFMEEPLLEYIVGRDCDLTQTGAGMGSRSFGIALQQDTLYLDAFNDALYNMRESGQLKNLRDIWWKERSGGQCSVEEEDESSSGAYELSVEELVGPLLVLAVGAALAIIIAVVECCCRAGVEATEKESGLCNEAAEQLQQALAGPSAAQPSIRVSSQ